MGANIYEERRLALGLTQREVARQAGIDVTTLRNIEHGKSKGLWDTRQKIRKVLDMPAEKAFSTDQRNEFVMQFINEGVVSYAIARHRIALDNLHADRRELEQECYLCMIRAIDRFQTDGVACLKTFVERNLDFFIKKWMMRQCLHGLSGSIHNGVPDNLYVVSIEAMRESGRDIAYGGGGGVELLWKLLLRTILSYGTTPKMLCGGVKST